MGDPILTRQELEDHWRDRLQDALDFYKLAQAEARKYQVGPDSLISQSPDIAFAIAATVQAEAAALHEYTRILMAFNDLVLEGKIPAEPPQPACQSNR